MKLKTEINHFRWLLTALLLVAAMVVPSVAWAAGIIPSKPAGDGTANNPYQIGTAAELYWFAGLVNGDSNVCTDGVTKNSAACAKLTENIVVNSNLLSSLAFDSETGAVTNGTSFKAWTTIGNGSKWFTGTFDGKGKTISGLYFNNGGQSYVGLFGWIYGGTVKNVGVVDSYINGGNNTGGLCGQNVGTISNCYYIGSVSGNLTVGGLCGNNTSTISNCYSIGSVSGNGTFVGGLCGQNSGTIKHCYYNSQIYTGNAVGYNNGYVEKVEGKTTAQFKSGEVAWLLNEGTADGTQVWYQTLSSDDYPVFDSDHGTVRQCSPCTGVYTNTDELSAQHDYDNGGTCTKCGHSVYEPATLIGDVYQIGSYSQLYWFAQKVNNDNEHYRNAKAVLTADITVNTAVLDENGNLVSNVSGFRSWTPIGNSSSNAYSGTFDGQGHTISGLYFNNTETDNVGLFGISSGTIKNLGVLNSYIKGNKYVGAVCGSNNAGGKIENCYNAGYVDGNRHYVGGLCGSNYGEIACSYNKGTVAGAQFVGGVCGINQGGTIDNCYNAGSVSGTGYNIGGVCGSNWAIEPGITSTITNCYNIGNVSGDRIVGGVCGKNVTGQGGSSTITNCYYNSQIYTENAIGDNNGTVEKVEGKTTEQFKSGEVAWLLNDSTSEGNLAWYQNIGSGTLDNYPVLDNNHQVVVACTLPESTPHGTVKVTKANDVAITSTDGDRIFVANGMKIVATPYETSSVKYKVKSLQVNETEFTSGGSIDVNNDITVTAEFTLDWFVVNGVKYQIMDGVSDVNTVRVIGVTHDDKGAAIIPVSVSYDEDGEESGYEPVVYTIIIGANAFAEAQGLKTLYVNSTSPLSIEAGSTPFEGIASTVTLRVPYGEMDAYKNDNCPWKVFTDIRSFVIEEGNFVDYWRIKVVSTPEFANICTISDSDSDDAAQTYTNSYEVKNGTTLQYTITAPTDFGENNKSYVIKSLNDNDGAVEISGEDCISKQDGVTVNGKDITISVEFALKEFNADGLKYKAPAPITDNSKVTVTGPVDPNTTEVTIPATVTCDEKTYDVTAIAANAFSGYRSLTKITFKGSTPPTIGNNAFNSNVIEKIIVPSSKVEAYKDAFDNDLKDKVVPSQVTVTLSAISCGTIKIYYTDNSEEIPLENGVFKVDAGREITIKAVPNSGYGFSWMKIDEVQQAGAEVRTTLDHDITISASFYYIIPSVFMYDDVCYEKRWDANYWEEVTVRNLDYYYYNKYYTGDLELPEKVYYYGDYYKVTAINERAFRGSSELRNLVIPSTVNKIGSYAFEGCTGLEKLVVKSPSAATRAATTEPTVPTVDEHAFDDICKTAVLYVPENWKEAFKAAPEWRKFFEVKEQREDGTVLAELTMTSTYGGTLAVGEIVSESDTRIVKVAEGSSVTVEVTPREGYMLTNLSYDGTDVMDQLVEGKLTLAGISGEKYITAVFGIDTGIGNSDASSQKVYVKDGRIVVDGVAAGEEILIYNASGQLLRSEVANGERLEIPMTSGQMYVVKIGKQIVKI